MTKILANRTTQINQKIFNDYKEAMKELGITQGQLYNAISKNIQVKDKEGNYWFLDSLYENKKNGAK